MSDYWSEEAMEARQEARREALRRCGNPPRRERPAQPRSEQDERLAAGFIFSVRDEQVAEAQADDRARRRQADAAVAQRDHLWHALRDSEGSDYADQWMSGGDAA